jgi:hypothetical protein
LPRLVVVVPLRGSAAAYVFAKSFEDEVALGVDLAHRELLAEIELALEQLLDALDDRREEAA